MYQMNHNIIFDNDGKKYKLQLLHSVDITASVDMLADTAVIVLPEYVMNSVLNIRDKIGRGTKVSIELGYNDKLNQEFVGYVVKIVDKDGSLNIECEDALFLFRQKVTDKVFKPGKASDILNYVVNEIDSSYTVVNDYDVTYEKFVIHQAEGYDVLKKLQEETKADIYFDNFNKELHFHPKYKEKGGEVVYDFSINVESSSLQWKEVNDEKIEITIECTGTDGKVRKVTQGTTGGTQRTERVGAMSSDDLTKIAENYLKQYSNARYEGGIDTWLFPVVKPTFSALIINPDYPERDGKYYVVAVKTLFSDGGGKRTVELGIKLSA